MKNNAAFKVQNTRGLAAVQKYLIVLTALQHQPKKQAGVIRKDWTNRFFSHPVNAL